MLLRLLGNEVRTVHEGLEAVAAAESFRPDVILLDIGMPDMDGYEVAQTLRGRYSDKKVGESGASRVNRHD
jgi:CheY-like chemotaxis protein